MRSLQTALILCLSLGPAAGAMGLEEQASSVTLTGTYTAPFQGAMITLNLEQSSDGTLSGTWRSSNGKALKLSGHVKEGHARGTATGPEGILEFTGQLVQGKLKMLFRNPATGESQPMILKPGGPGETDSGAAAASETTGNPALMQHFAGTWVTSTRNTEEQYALYPDGRYEVQSEAGYSGADYGSDWSSASQGGGQGRWTAQGTPQQGTITMINAQGGQSVVPYRVNMQNGEPYWNEYYFDGVFYYRQAIAR
jgi:hypothetical protein